MIDKRQTPEEKLDAVLLYLNNDLQYQETHTQISERSKLKYGDKELYLILDKLTRDSYISFSFALEKGKVTDLKTYHITFQGRLFLSRGGYRNESKNLKRKSNWTTIKTMAATLNAISIILIGIWGVFVSRGSDLKNEEVAKLKATIDSLTIKNKDANITISDTTSLKPNLLKRK